MFRALLAVVFLTLALGCRGKAPTPVLSDEATLTGPEIAPSPRPVVANAQESDDNLEGQIEKAKIELTAAKCATIERAIDAYMLKPQTNGKPPPSLMALVTGFPDSGIKPVLDGGEKALLDPWGGKFEFEMVQDGFRSVPKVMAITPGGRVITSSKWAAKAKK